MESTIAEDKAAPKFSKASKMPCLSWSLPAVETCPGSTIFSDKYNGKLENWNTHYENFVKDSERVPSCQGCYATTGNYLYKNVKAVREHNVVDWQKPDWVSKMVSTIKHERYFRFFDSGDIYCVELAEKIKEVCRRCPDTKFWIPTLAWKIPAIMEALETIAELENVTVRCSQGSVMTGNAIDLEVFGYNQFSIVVENPETVASKKGIVVCSAYNRDGKCGQCRACWSKRVEYILYPAHGVVMKSKIKKNFEV